MVDRSALARFGGGWSWEIADGTKLNIGQVIAAEGPGKGVGLVPWALDEYERVLRLRPGEAWLLRRMLTHAWSYNTPVFLSMRAMTLRALVDRRALYRYLTHLEKLHYIRRISDGNGMDRRRRYDVSGLYSALAICIAADPRSKWAKANGPLPVSTARRLPHSGPPSQNGNGSKASAATTFNLDFKALARLVSRGVDNDDSDE